MNADVVLVEAISHCHRTNNVMFIYLSMVCECVLARASVNNTYNRKSINYFLTGVKYIHRNSVDSQSRYYPMLDVKILIIHGILAYYRWNFLL